MCTCRRCSLSFLPLSMPRCIFLFITIFVVKFLTNHVAVWCQMINAISWSVVVRMAHWLCGRRMGRWSWSRSLVRMNVLAMLTFRYAFASVLGLIDRSLKLWSSLQVVQLHAYLICWSYVLLMLHLMVYADRWNRGYGPSLCLFYGYPLFASDIASLWCSKG